MLETIREFGNERLLESSDREAARQAYAAYYLKLAEEAAQEIQGPQRKKWLDRLDQEHGNLPAVMEWLLPQEDVVPAAIKRTELQEQALRLANALNQFWTQRGYLNEGWRFVEQVLLAYDGGDTLPLARAYLLAASLSMRLGNLERAGALVEQSINCGNALGNKAHLAQSLRMSGWIAHQSGQGDRAYGLYEQSLALFKELDDRKEITNTMHNMAFLLQTRGDSEQANALLEEVVTRQRALHNKTGLYGALYQLALSLFSLDEQPPLERIHALLLEALALAEEAGEQRGIAGIQGLLGWVIFSEGQLSEARKLVEGCLLFYNSGGDREFYGQYLAILGEIRAAQGDYAAARSVFEESLAIGKELNGKSEITAVALEGLADLELVLGEYKRAVRLWAKAARQREEIDVPLMPRLRPARERSLDQLRTLLGEKTFTDQWEQGYAQSPDEM
jgi:tetratricopeptide (TPR) repeat protein